jgi:hypothetical protein
MAQKLRHKNSVKSGQHKNKIDAIVESTRAHKIIHNLPYEENNTNVTSNKRGFIVFPRFTKEQMEEIGIKILNKFRNNVI